MTSPSVSIKHRTIAIAARLALAVAIAAGIAPRAGCAATPASIEAQFTFAGGPRALEQAPGVYEWRFIAKPGPTFYDKIALHRIALGPRVEQHRAITVLYLPGTNMNGEIALENPRYSFPVYLAAHGVDVWTMDYRTHFVPGGIPEQTIAPVMKHWTNELFAGDIESAAEFILHQTKSEKIFVAGFSRGVEFAYLFAAMHPGEVRGIVALDGFLPRHPTTQEPRDRIVDDIGGAHLTYEKRRMLMQFVIDNPDGPAPIAKYKTARENLIHVVYDAKEFGGKGGLANPVDGHSDPVVLARLLIGYDRYWPAVQDYENPFTPPRLRSLKESMIPVIAFSSTNITTDWPAWVDESAHSTGSKDVTFTKFPGWGHLDVLCGTAAEEDVFARTLGWLKRHAK
jgi:pimeloyl-ACP methyl ester carboxylesterase